MSQLSYPDVTKFHLDIIATMAYILGDHQAFKRRKYFLVTLTSDTQAIVAGSNWVSDFYQSPRMRYFMIANFTSVILENGLVPIAPSIQKRLGLSQGDQVSISIKVLGRPKKRQPADARYAELLAEKDLRILTPREQAELIALANAEFDSAIARAKKILYENTPELFDAQGRLKKRKALAALSHGKRQIGARRGTKI